MKRMLLTFAACAGLVTASQAKPNVNVRLVNGEGPINLFSAAQTNIAIAVTTDASGNSRLTWRLAANKRTLDRGESVLMLSAGERVETRVPLRVPEVKPGVVFQATLS